MRITINLASHPYVELRPIYTRLRLWMLVLAVLAVPFGWLLHIEKQRAAAATAHVRAMQTRVDQLQSLDPQMSPDGHVTIRMRVTGQRERALDLVKNLESSKHFASPRLAGEALATSSQGNQPMPVSASATDVNFDILADYRPLPGDEKAAAKQPVQQAQKGAAQ